MWYAAHGIFYFRHRKRSPKQKLYVVWENIYVIQAGSDEEALEKAEQRALRDCSDDDPSTTVDDIPVRMIFAGIRKVHWVFHDALGQVAEPEPIGSGDEVTFSKFHVNDLKTIRLLARGKAVKIRYVE